MIQVNIYKTNNLITAFELAGHAESGPYGYDLVCAGVSAVTFGAVNAVMEICDIELDIKQNKGGYLYVKLPKHITQEIKEKACLLFESMLISLETIERDYSQHITITQKREVL